mmetsp:Transcript_19972/g.79639  ORF Transcript_19972/g.79639 Transcript_19972/m.79639 type:complete len:215 (+) Transcript_19972:45-689(+)
MRLTAYLYAALWATDIARAFGGFAFLRRHGAPAPAAAATDVVAPPEPHAAAEPLVACRDDAAPREDPHLESLRRSIDNFDAAIVHLLAERFKVTKAVGEYKAKAGLVASDPEREARQVARLRRLADEAGLDPEFSEKFLRFIVRRSPVASRCSGEETTGLVLSRRCTRSSTTTNKSKRRSSPRRPRGVTTRTVDPRSSGAMATHYSAGHRWHET